MKQYENKKDTDGKLLCAICSVNIEVHVNEKFNY